MPTTLPRRWVTETPEVHQALELARTRWGEKPTTQLLTLLIIEGAERVAVDPDTRREQRRATLRSLSEEHPWRAGPDHLEKVREGWPE
jgi:hypothetical protein